jgi:hypothetical protein
MGFFKASVSMGTAKLHNAISVKVDLMGSTHPLPPLFNTKSMENQWGRKSMKINVKINESKSMGSNQCNQCVINGNQWGQIELIFD